MISPVLFCISLVYLGYVSYETLDLLNFATHFVLVIETAILYLVKYKHIGKRERVIYENLGTALFIIGDFIVDNISSFPLTEACMSTPIMPPMDVIPCSPVTIMFYYMAAVELTMFLILIKMLDKKGVKLIIPLIVMVASIFVVVFIF